MNNKIISFIITFIAGISTVIGIVPTYFNDINKDRIINYSLSFSVGVMITISLLSLIPEAIGYLNINSFVISILITLIFINIGIIISSYIDRFVDKKIDSNLKKIGIVSIIALILHNIPEGIITYITSSSDLELGIRLALAIAIHNIPEGIAIAVPLYYATSSRKKAVFYTLISGFSETLGAVLTSLFLFNFVNNTILSIILSMTAGIMIYISLFELLPTIKKYNNYIGSIVMIILGIIIMILTLKV